MVPYNADLPANPAQESPDEPVHDRVAGGHPVTVTSIVPFADPAGYLFPEASTPLAYSALTETLYDPFLVGVPVAMTRFPDECKNMFGGNGEPAARLIDKI